MYAWLMVFFIYFLISNEKVTDPELILERRVLDLPVLSTWSKGRTVLLGGDRKHLTCFLYLYLKGKKKENMQMVCALFSIRCCSRCHASPGSGSKSCFWRWHTPCKLFDIMWQCEVKGLGILDIIYLFLLHLPVIHSIIDWSSR